MPTPSETREPKRGSAAASTAEEVAVRHGQELYRWLNDLTRGTDCYGPDLEDCVETIRSAITEALAAATVKEEPLKGLLPKWAEDLADATTPMPSEVVSEETGLAPCPFRKKPVVITAWQITDESAVAIAAWCGGQHLAANQFRRQEVAIQTPEGIMVGSGGDWIIKGVKGEFYPCKPDIFAATYERVQGSETPAK